MTDSKAFVTDVAALLKDAEALRRDLLLATPDPQSAAHHDLDTATAQLGSPDAVERVLRLVDLWTMLEAEHLSGISVLVADATTVFPMFPLLRAVVEHGAWVCFLLDPAVDSRQRAIRAALAQLRSDKEIMGVAKRWAGPNTAEYRSAADKLDKTRKAIVRDFGDLDTQKSSIHGETMATPTMAIEHFGRCDGTERQWRGTYDYLCGTANHPSENAFEFVEIDADGKAYLTLTESFLNRMARVGLSVFMHSLAHTADYVGAPREAMRQYQIRVDSVLGPDTPGRNV